MADAATLTLTDPTFTAPARASLFYRAASRLIRDERDVPFIRLALTFTLTIVPAGLSFYIPGVWTPLGAAVYLGLYAWQMGPYILMLHNTSHRKLFKPGLGLLNHWVPTFLAPFFGETPETYYAHHVGMHHPENNLPDDLSSTMRFDRSSVIGFVRYFSRFFFGVMVDMIRYMRARKRYKLIRRMLVGEISLYAVWVALAFVSWQATLTVFVIPFVFTRVMMMAGNWGQHAFIDRNDPGNSLLNSITCINTGYNRRCFNDGYHIGHHVTPNRHWTEMPEDFLRSRDDYARAGGIVFEGIDFFGVWLLLMLKRFDWLAKRYVHLGEARPSHGEIVALLKERTLPIPG